jgi:hypothetical protein
VTLFGLTSLGVALWYLVRPVRQTLTLVIGFSTATLLAGCLGAATGVQRSAAHIGEVAAGERWIFLVGLKESLNNLTMALVVVCLVTLIATIGAWRGAREEEVTAATRATAAT